MKINDQNETNPLKEGQHFYCFWRKRGEDIMLLNNIATCFTKKEAFKVAESLRHTLRADLGETLLVRKITVGSLYADEWEFEPIEE